jgi:hypothetical protein
MRIAFLLCCFATFLMVGPTAYLEYHVPVRLAIAALVIGYIVGSLRGRRGNYEE